MERILDENPYFQNSLQYLLTLKFLRFSGSVVFFKKSRIEI